MSDHEQPEFAGADPLAEAYQVAPPSIRCPVDRKRALLIRETERAGIYQCDTCATETARARLPHEPTLPLGQAGDREVDNPARWTLPDLEREMRARFGDWRRAQVAVNVAELEFARALRAYLAAAPHGTGEQVARLTHLSTSRVSQIKRGSRK